VCCHSCNNGTIPILVRAKRYGSPKVNPVPMIMPHFFKFKKMNCAIMVLSHLLAGQQFFRLLFLLSLVLVLVLVSSF